MAKPKINQHILDMIQEKTGEDKMMKEFLTNMLFKEVTSPPGWWWKREYKRVIEECCRGR